MINPKIELEQKVLIIRNSTNLTRNYMYRNVFCSSRFINAFHTHVIDLILKSDWFKYTETEYDTVCHENRNISALTYVNICIVYLSHIPYGQWAYWSRSINFSNENNKSMSRMKTKSMNRSVMKFLRFDH